MALRAVFGNAMPSRQEITAAIRLANRAEVNTHPCAPAPEIIGPTKLDIQCSALSARSGTSCMLTVEEVAAQSISAVPSSMQAYTMQFLSMVHPVSARFWRTGTAKRSSSGGF